MKKYDIWASLWNFEISSGRDITKIGKYQIIKYDRPNFSDDFWNRIINQNLSQNDQRLLFLLAHLYTTQGHRDIPPYIITTQVTYKDKFDFSLADRMIKSMIFFLRLYTKGDVVGRLIAGTPSEQKYGHNYFFDIDNHQGIQNKYFLDSPNRFSHFCKKFGDISNLMDYVSIDRFNISYNHFNSPIEKLIDLIIVLESLFNKQPSDIKFKVALRASHLLYPKGKDKTHDIYLLIKEAYDMRNDIVHGVRKINDNDINKIQNISNNLNDVVRKILIKVILLNQKGVIDIFTERDENKIDKFILNC